MRHQEKPGAAMSTGGVDDTGGGAVRGGDVEAGEAGVADAKDVRDEGESASRPPSGFWMSDDK
jgi:hypothetical protein